MEGRHSQTCNMREKGFSDSDGFWPPPHISAGTCLGLPFNQNGMARRDRPIKYFHYMRGGVNVSQSEVLENDLSQITSFLPMSSLGGKHSEEDTVSGTAGMRIWSLKNSAGERNAGSWGMGCWLVRKHRTSPSVLFRVAGVTRCLNTTVSESS